MGGDVAQPGQVHPGQKRHVHPSHARPNQPLPQQTGLRQAGAGNESVRVQRAIRHGVRVRLGEAEPARHVRAHENGRFRQGVPRDGGPRDFRDEHANHRGKLVRRRVRRAGPRQVPRGRRGRRQGPTQGARGPRLFPVDVLHRRLRRRRLLGLQPVRPRSVRSHGGEAVRQRRLGQDQRAHGEENGGARGVLRAPRRFRRGRTVIDPAARSRDVKKIYFFPDGARATRLATTAPGGAQSSR
mmetsp:Transcript_12923/g.55513  ORF Transcript_12923/g.55513 Transcript_12923/m.55513 type:complete len:241 (+) Transcript_12923:1945-2667(+)